MGFKFNKYFTLLILIGCILGLGVLTYGGAVSDNDGSGYITKGEYEAIKGNLQNGLDSLNKEINNSIDGSIGVALSTLIAAGEGTDDERLGIMFPIGFVVIQNAPPAFGTWEEITDSEGRCLWVDNSAEFGQFMVQGMPTPKWDVEEYKHGHTFQGKEVTSSEDGKHSHTIDYLPWISAQQTVEKGDGKYLTNSNDDAAHTPHKHEVVPKGKLTDVEHSHEATLITPFTGEPGSKVQPNAYVVKMWKRTA